MCLNLFSLFFSSENTVLSTPSPALQSIRKRIRSFWTTKEIDPGQPVMSVTGVTRTRCFIKTSFLFYNDTWLSRADRMQYCELHTVLTSVIIHAQQISIKCRIRDYFVCFNIYRYESYFWSSWQTIYPEPASSEKTLSNMRLSSKSSDAKIMVKSMMLINPNRFGCTYFRKPHPKRSSQE